MKQTKIKKTSRIPEFKNREEEAKFWETHSFSEFSDEVKPVNVKFAKNLSEGITIRFDGPTLTKIRKIAHEKGLGPTTLARMWILDSLKHQDSL
jgi:predicted DNA binding CopG/RHH family protein